MNIKSCLILLFICLELIKLTSAQNDSILLTESTLTQIQLSYIQDEIVFFGKIKSIDEWQVKSTEELNKLKIVPSSILKGDLYSPNKLPLNMYNIQLFKIYMRPDYPRYLLAVRLLPQIGNPDGFFRLKGYTENDFIHLYEGVLLKYVSKKKARQLIKEWQSQDSIFAEIDFDCLIRAVESKKTNTDCFKSIAYQLEKEILYMSSPPPRKDAYSEYGRFSKEPFRRIDL